LVNIERLSLAFVYVLLTDLLKWALRSTLITLVLSCALNGNRDEAKLIY